MQRVDSALIVGQRPVGGALDQDGQVGLFTLVAQVAEGGVAGARFWDPAVEEYELSELEVSLLLEVCRLLDECEELRAAVERDGMTVPGST